MADVRIDALRRNARAHNSFTKLADGGIGSYPAGRQVLSVYHGRMPPRPRGDSTARKDAAELCAGSPSTGGALWPAKGTKGTVAFVDVDDTSYQVYVGELREAFAKISQRDGRQARARVVLVEA
jgi:hypothetical protein